MALNMGQLTVGTIGKFLVQVGGGPGQLLITSEGPGTAFVGGTNLTPGNGALVPAGGLSIPLFQGSGATQVYACVNGGSPSVISWILSTSYGLGANSGGQ